MTQEETLNGRGKDLRRRYYFQYETESGTDTVSFVACFLGDAYKMFEEKLGKPEPQIINVHSEELNTHNPNKTQ